MAKTVFMILIGIIVALVVVRMSLLLFLVWTAGGAILGLLAARRLGFSLGRGFFEGAALGWLALLLFGANVRDDQRVTQLCPFCAERIKVEAVVCKHCGKDLPQALTDVSKSGVCRKCSHQVPIRATVCPHCHSPIRADHRLESITTGSKNVALGERRDRR